MSGKNMSLDQRLASPAKVVKEMDSILTLDRQSWNVSPMFSIFIFVQFSTIYYASK